MSAKAVPETHGKKVFFSYSRKDAGFVLKVASQLRADGRAVWLDQLDIPKGSRWDEEVEAALKDCWCLVVVLSPASAGSPNVQDEVSYALENGKRVVPLLLSPCEVPFRLKRIQYIDFSAGYGQAYRELLGAIEPDSPGHAAPHPATPAGSAAARSSMAKAIPLFGGALAAGLFIAQREWREPDAKPPVRETEQALTPPSVPVTPAIPTTPAAPPDMTDEQLSGFVDRYIAAQKRGDLGDLLSLYDAQVRYFGDQAVDRDFIRDDKQRFYHRWPQVESRLTGPIHIDRLANGRVRLSFPITWRARGPDRESAGTALNELELRLVDGEPRIVAERQEVQRREERR